MNISFPSLHNTFRQLVVQVQVHTIRVWHLSKFIPRKPGEIRLRRCVRMWQDPTRARRNPLPKVRKFERLEVLVEKTAGDTSP
jgi:hypothetical protein